MITKKIKNESALATISKELGIKNIDEYLFFALAVKKQDIHKEHKPKRKINNARRSMTVLDDSKVLETLKDEFPDLPVAFEIKKAKDYVRSTGRKYNDYVAFMRNWLRRVKKQKKGIPKI
jgi:hypothetical protein